MRRSRMVGRWPCEQIAVAMPRSESENPEIGVSTLWICRAQGALPQGMPRLGVPVARRARSYTCRELCSCGSGPWPRLGAAMLRFGMPVARRARSYTCRELCSCGSGPWPRLGAAMLRLGVPVARRARSYTCRELCSCGSGPWPRLGAFACVGAAPGRDLGQPCCDLGCLSRAGRAPTLVPRLVGSNWPGCG